MPKSLNHPEYQQVSACKNWRVMVKKHPNYSPSLVGANRVATRLGFARGSATPTEVANWARTDRSGFEVTAAAIEG